MYNETSLSLFVSGMCGLPETFSCPTCACYKTSVHCAASHTKWLVRQGNLMQIKSELKTRRARKKESKRRRWPASKSCGSRALSRRPTFGGCCAKSCERETYRILYRARRLARMKIKLWPRSAQTALERCANKTLNSLVLLLAVHHRMRHAGARKFRNIRKTRNSRAIRFEMSSSAVPPGCMHVPKNKETFYRPAPSECWTCLFLIWRVPLVSAASLQWHVLCTQSNCGALATHRDRKRPPLHAETCAPVWCCCCPSLYHLFLSRVFHWRWHTKHTPTSHSVLLLFCSLQHQISLGCILPSTLYVVRSPRSDYKHTARACVFTRSPIKSSENINHSLTWDGIQAGWKLMLRHALREC